MKKLNILYYFFLIPFTLLCVFVFNINSKALNEKVNIKENLVLIADAQTDVRLASTTDDECSAFFSQDLINLLQDVFDVFKFVDVVLVLVLTIVSFTQAIVKGGDDLKKAINITIKRVVIGVILFFVPTLINFFFDAIGLYGTCGIG